VDRGIRIKLEKYDGKTAIAAFLAKFEVCARCNNWSDREKADQLMCALTGPASQLLWDMGAQHDVSWQALVAKLKDRYGSENQTNLYRTKLRTYRQAPGETLSMVVQEIRRLMVLAYPGPTNEVVESIACDAFIDALVNHELAQKVREREPVDLEAAYKHAVRLEAYGRQPMSSGDMDRRLGRIKATKEDPPVSVRMDPTGQRMSDLEQRIEFLTKELSQLRSGTESGSRSYKSGDGWNRSDQANEGSGIRGQPLGQQGEFQPRRWNTADRICFLCRNKGHIRRNCPQLKTSAGQEPERNDQNNTEFTPGHAQSRLVKGSRMAYIITRLNGIRRQCLLDSGSEMSLVPRRFVPDDKVVPSAQRLLAANGSEIQVDGEAMLTVHIARKSYPLPCLITDQVNEVILGLSWLEANQANWDFAGGYVRLGEARVPLKTTSAELRCWSE
jgi:hypothetical protein